MTRYPTLAVLVAAAALAASLLAGDGRRPALIGSGIASLTALASLGAFGLAVRGGPAPLKRALAVFAAMFLVRLVLVALGAAAVVRAGESVAAFALAFFVPFFLFAAIEGAYLHALGQKQGRPA